MVKKDLHFSKLALKFVLRLLTPEQKCFRVALCEQNLQKLREDSEYLNRVVTGDELWVSIYEIELKKDSREWHLKGSNCRPIKAIQNRSVKKAMLTVFFDTQGLIFSEFLPPRTTVDMDYYCSVLRKLKEDIQRKRPHLWRKTDEGYRTFYLHQDNAPPHMAAMTLGLIRTSSIDMVPHPPYSPDLAPCDFFYFWDWRVNWGAIASRTWQTWRQLWTGLSKQLIHQTTMTQSILSQSGRWNVSKPTDLISKVSIWTLTLLGTTTWNWFTWILRKKNELLTFALRGTPIAKGLTWTVIFGIYWQFIGMFGMSFSVGMEDWHVIHWLKKVPRWSQILNSSYWTTNRTLRISLVCWFCSISETEKVVTECEEVSSRSRWQCHHRCLCKRSASSPFYAFPQNVEGIIFDVPTGLLQTNTNNHLCLMGICAIGIYMYVWHFCVSPNMNSGSATEMLVPLTAHKFHLHISSTNTTTFEFKTIQVSAHTHNVHPFLSSALPYPLFFRPMKV